MPRFKKLAGTHHRMEKVPGDNKYQDTVYKKGDIIEATEEELRHHDPQMKTWEKVIETKESEKEEEKVTEKMESKPTTEESPVKIIRQIPKTGIEAVKRDDDTGWDVVGLKNGKQVKIYNDKPLTQEEAEKLVQEFSV